MEMLMTVFISTPPVIWTVGWCFQKLAKIRRDRIIINDAIEQGWTRIGTVKFMCVYPIDSGRAIKTNEAYFGQYGLRTINENDNGTIPTHIYDRSFLVYSNANPPRIILNDNNLSSISDKNVAVRQLWNTLRPIAHTLRTQNEPSTPMQYINRSIPVRVLSNVGTNSALNAFNFPDHRFGGIGYCSQRTRKEFNTAAKQELRGSIECYNPNFSSFTMVNSKSIIDLQATTFRYDLSYKNFRPHIVFKGLRPYIEENIKALRIGNLEFSNVTPSSPDINIDNFIGPAPQPMVCGDDAYHDPYEYLTVNRPINRLLGPEFQMLDGPAFGINFESEEGLPEENPENNGVAQEDAATEEVTLLRNVIMEGYQVFAKYE